MGSALESAKEKLKEVNMARLGLLKTVKDSAEVQWDSLVESGKDVEEIPMDYNLETLKKTSAEAKHAVRGLYKLGLETVSNGWNDLVEKGTPKEQSK